MWENFIELPTALIVDHIFRFLNLKSIALLERALTSPDKLATFHSFLELCPAFEGTVYVSTQMSKMRWLQKRRCRIAKGVIYLEQLKAAVDVDQIDELTLYVRKRLIPNQIDMLSDVAYKNISQVDISVDDQDRSIMLELFSRLKNIRTLSAPGNIDDWIEDALNSSTNSTSLESITLKHIPTSQTTVAAIVKHCPNLLSLEVFRFADTHEALLTLSEHKLPKELLGVSHALSELSITQAARCAHALSRIRSLCTSRASWPADLLLGLAPYLTGLKGLWLKSKIDHKLLPLLAQHSLSLERVRICTHSSVTVELLAVLIQSNRDSLTSLRINSDLSIAKTMLLKELMPYCPHLQGLTYM